jgi:hypothetical protein
MTEQRLPSVGKYTFQTGSGYCRFCLLSSTLIRCTFCVLKAHNQLSVDKRVSEARFSLDTTSTVPAIPPARVNGVLRTENEAVMATNLPRIIKPSHVGRMMIAKPKLPKKRSVTP